jgi:L-fuconolactonase
MIVVDTQVHIWAPNTPDRPWVLGPERAHLPVPLDAETVIKMMDEAGVDRAILVPPSLDGDRNDLCLKAARDYPRRFAVMGRLQLDHPNAPERLKEMKSQPGMLGVRLTFHRDNDRPMLTNGVADWFWPAAETLGVPVMVHAPERLPQVAEIARRHPKLTIIVDHMGFARETSDDRANAGADRILALARTVPVPQSARTAEARHPGFWCAPLILGQRSFTRFGTLQLSSDRDDVHRGAGLPIAKRSRMGDGAGRIGETALGVTP